MNETYPLFNASLPALGYLYQFRYALLLALQHEEDPALQMSIEKLDDVAFFRDGVASVNGAESFQFKHHIKSTGGLSDKSADIWKTIRIWSELVLSKKINLDHAVFIMVTTSSSDKRHASHRLLADPSVRDTAEALRLLETAGKCSKSKEIHEAYCALMRLSAAQRRRMFERIYLMEGSPDILAVREKLETRSSPCGKAPTQGCFRRAAGRLVVRHCRGTPDVLGSQPHDTRWCCTSASP